MNKNLIAEILFLEAAKQLDPLAEKEKLLKQEGKRFKQQQKLLSELIKEPLGQLYELVTTGPPKELAVQIQNMFPGNPSTQKKTWMKVWDTQVKAKTNLMSYLANFGKENERELYLAIRKSVFSEKPREIKNFLVTVLENIYKEKVVLQEGGVPLKNVMPAEFLQYFPEYLTVVLNENKKLVEMRESFGNQKVTWKYKTNVVTKILQQYKTVKQILDKDLNARDEKTRICALITSIIYATGIRPGSGEGGLGKSIIRDSEGNKEEIETFGATSLKPEHVKILGDKAELSFIGKAGTPNKAEITDVNILKVLKNYVEAAEKNAKSQYLFVKKNGERITYDDVTSYMHGIFSILTPKNFRWLLATRTLYAELAKQTQSLKNELIAYREGLKTAAESQMVKVISNKIASAWEATAKMMSHEDWGVTMQNYALPQIMLSFATEGGIKRALEDVVGNNAVGTIEFNAQNWLKDLFEKQDIVIAKKNFEFNLKKAPGQSLNEMIEELDKWTKFFTL